VQTNQKTPRQGTSEIHKLLNEPTHELYGTLTIWRKDSEFMEKTQEKPLSTATRNHHWGPHGSL